MDITAQADLSQDYNLSGFSRMVALFLSEIIRSRRTSLRRAAEISTSVISGLKQINSEEQALRYLTSVEKEFEEVSSLKQALHFGYKDSSVSVYEKEVKEFASDILKTDLKLSAVFLQDAASADISIQDLCIKYPNFCEYLLNSTDKGQILRKIE